MIADLSITLILVSSPTKPRRLRTGGLDEIFSSRRLVNPWQGLDLVPEAEAEPSLPVMAAKL
jgi:hypothetical protein